MEARYHTRFTTIGCIAPGRNYRYKHRRPVRSLCSDEIFIEEVTSEVVHVLSLARNAEKPPPDNWVVIYRLLNTKDNEDAAVASLEWFVQHFDPIVEKEETS